MLALVNGVPKVLTLKQILEEYLNFQVEVVTRRMQFDLKKAKEREHILQGLIIALDFIDEVIKIIRSSQTPAEAKAALIERFGISDIQAEYIANMRLIQLTGLERQKIYDELDALEAKIRGFEEILGSHEKLLDVIITEIDEIKAKFDDPRRTEIQAISGEVDIEDLIGGHKRSCADKQRLHQEDKLIGVRGSKAGRQRHKRHEAARGGLRVRDAGVLHPRQHTLCHQQGHYV